MNIKILIFKNYADKILHTTLFFVSIYAYWGPDPKFKGIRMKSGSIVLVFHGPTFN